MRIRVDSTSLCEYAGAINFGVFLWQCQWPGFVVGRPDSYPPPPHATMLRLGYKYIGMLEAANDLAFNEIYAKLLQGRIGTDLIDNGALTAIQKIAYIVDRIGCVATSHPDSPDVSLFEGLAIPLIEPYVDLKTPMEIAG